MEVEKTLHSLTDLYREYCDKKFAIHQNPDNFDNKLYVLEEETKIKINKIVYLLNQK